MIASSLSCQRLRLHERTYGLLEKERIAALDQELLKRRQRAVRPREAHTVARRRSPYPPTESALLKRALISRYVKCTTERTPTNYMSRHRNVRSPGGQIMLEIFGVGTATRATCEKRRSWLSIALVVVWAAMIAQGSVGWAGEGDLGPAKTLVKAEATGGKPLVCFAWPRGSTPG